MGTTLAERRLRAKIAAQLDRALSDFAHVVDIAGCLSNCAAITDPAQRTLRELDAATLLALPSTQAAQLLSKLNTASALLSVAVQSLPALD